MGVYALLAALLVAVLALGEIGTAAARPLFMVGGVAIAYQAYRKGGLPLHAEVAITLFALGPFLRRIVDLHVGYDQAGTMLVAPLASLAIVVPELRVLLSPNSKALGKLLPYFLMTVCVLYAWAMSAFANNLVPSTVIASKYLLPLAYGMVLITRPDESEAILASAARIFMVLGPLIGLYGIIQHLAPQPWDQYWMVESKMVSIGQPVANEVRVFSTMNSPVSFAAYATCGLLLFSFAPRSFMPRILVPVLAILPLCLSILLTSVRTAWISAAISLIFCLLFRRTRGRATFLMICLGFGIAFALMFTSFGDTIADRFATAGNGTSDGSGDERMGDYIHVFSEDSRYIFGTGLAPMDPDQKMAALDGQVLMSAVQMGTTIGLLYIIGMIWAGGQALMTLRRDEGPLRLVAGALVVGNLFIIPLTAVGVGEIGFLFWMMVGTLSAPVIATRIPRPIPVVARLASRGSDRLGPI